MMAQLFSRRSDVLLRSGLSAATLLAMGTGGLIYALWRSPYLTRVDQRVDQPVPFSHQHHAGELGIDCRHCHTSVEKAGSAGMPSTETCINCHSYVWSDAAALEPVRESFRTGKPIGWTRVYDLPEFTYFHHGIHVQSGIACATCHGDVTEMALTYRAQALHMQTCLECHRHPEPSGRPLASQRLPPSVSVAASGQTAADAARIHQLSVCTICHR